MKNKKFIYILLAIVLLAGFLWFRSNSTENGDPAGSLISSVVSDITDGGEIILLPEQQLSSAAPESIPEPGSEAEAQASEDAPIDKDGAYDSKEDVALYIYTYGTLPPNYITKEEAMDAGWSGNGGDRLEKYCPGKCIGGSWFGNYEGRLPKAPGRTWFECDIDTLGAKHRGIKRIIFSNDGLIYYTEDHYETFELLYGDP